MRQLRQARHFDLMEIESLVKKVLPNDPVVLLLEDPIISNKFFQSLVTSIRVKVIVERNRIVGVIAVGSMFEVALKFLQNLSFLEFLSLASSFRQFRKAKVILEAALFVVRARYYPSKHEVFWLAVDPEFQGRGIGKALVLESTSLLPSSETYLIAKTLQSTPKNVDFYKSCGMLPIKELVGRVILAGTGRQICSALNKQKR